MTATSRIEEMIRRHCRRCYRPDDRAFFDRPDCPILNLALAGTRPTQWRDGGTCTEYTRPPIARTPKARAAGEQEQMFADEIDTHAGVQYVPVDGWPDRSAFR